MARDKAQDREQSGGSGEAEGAGAQDATGFRVELLGEARLVGPKGPPVRLERKAAALVACVALEGRVSRQRAAGLLWADSEETARANMRQLLRRLRLATGLPLVDGREELALLPGLAVDVLTLKGHLAAERHAEALALDGELLAGLAYEDMEEFQGWLVLAREGLSRGLERARVAEGERLVREGQLSRALRLAERRLERSPTSEDAYRALMRVHYLLGDRAAALGLYAQCREMLRRELDAAPMPETVALARDIEKAKPDPASARGALPRREALPASVLRPPVLVGREKAWAQLEACWQAGKMPFIHGEPGMGKSRFARDFAATKGGSWVFDSRPSDFEVPYTSSVRALRHMLGFQPGITFEPWVEQEMARLLPERAGAAHASPPPMLGERDQVRFYEAMRVAWTRCLQGLSCIIFDDYQFIDEASQRLGEYVFTSAYPLGDGFPQILTLYRTAELRGGSGVALQRMVDGGMAEYIPLEPLGEEQVRALVEGTGLPGAAAIAGELARYTGGNPLFVTETLRHLLETGMLGRGWPERLPPPGKVAPLIQQRLARLSRPALRLAQVAALATTAFTLEVAGEVLEERAVELDAPLAELEAAQILRGEAFTHDLIFEAVHAAVPPAVAQLFHRRLAEALARRNAPPATVANHWLATSQPHHALPFLLAAADAAEASLQHQEAGALRARAAALQQAAAGRGAGAAGLTGRA
jgi:DNA-binding SARP family transcriptional activator